MRLKSFIIVVFTLASILTLISSSMVNIAAITPDDGVDGVQYLTGTWAIINFPESYTDEIIILTGNLTSYNKLSLINTALRMNSTATNSYNINVYTSNANLTMTNNSVITSNNPQYKYDIIFNTGSHAYIENSTVSYAGYSGGLSEGILVKSNDVVFKNAVISNNYNGIVCFSTSPKILSSTIKNSVNKDVVLKGNSHPSVIDTSLDKTNVDVQDTSSLAINWHFSLKVMNASKGPMSNVKVTVKNASGATYATYTTDAQGMIGNRILPESIIYPDQTIDHSPYTVVLEMEEYRTEEIDNVVLDKITALEATMILRPPDGMIGGKVTDSNGDPLQGVKIAVEKDEKELGVEYTNSSGEYMFPEIPEDAGYNITASKDPEYESDVASEVAVTGNNQTDIDFNLSLRELPVAVNPADGADDVSPDSFITVTFEDVMNLTSVIANFELKERATNSEVTGTIKTVDNKTYIFTPDSNLLYGKEYLITIFKFIKNQANERPLWRDFQSDFNTGWGAPAILTYQPTGIDVPSTAQIIVSFDQSMNRTTVEDAITINPPGIFTYTWSSYLGIPDAIVTVNYNLLPGILYNVSIDASAKSAQDILMSDMFSWEFTTKQEWGVLKGKVIDENGDPIKGARVTVEGASSPVPLTGTTADNGTFTIPNIPEGSYTINISANKFETKLETFYIGPGVNDRASVTLVPGESDIKVEEEDKEDELPNDLLAAYSIIILLVIIILVLIVLLALKRKEEEQQVAEGPPEEERVGFSDLGIEPVDRDELDEGAEVGEPVVPKPPYRGRCPTCKHAVYGDYGCFYCATGGTQRY